MFKNLQSRFTAMAVVLGLVFSSQSLIAQTINVTGLCIETTATLSITGTFDGKNVWEGTATVNGGSMPEDIGIYWDASFMPPRWFLTISGQPKFQNTDDTTLPPSTSNVGAWTPTVDNMDCTSGANPLSVTGPSTSAAEINVKQNATNLADGDSYNYGNVNVGSMDSKVFTIENTGDFTLTLTGTPPNYVTKGGTNPGDFTITQPASGSIAAPGNTMFTVVFSPGGPGARSCTLQIPNSDGNENPYDITLNGTGVAVCTPPTVNPPTVTQPTCATPTGTIVVNATGSGALEYSIDDGDSWQSMATFSMLGAGSYDLKVRLQSDNTCMTAYSGNPVVITAAPAPANAAISITENNIFFNPFTNLAYYNVSLTDGILCTGPSVPNPTTSATLTASGGVTYLWSTSATTAAITVSTAGTYTVVVTNAAGCQSSASKTISVNAAPNSGIVSAVPQINGGNGYGVCANSTITLSSTVPGGVWGATNKFPSPQVVSADPMTGLITPLLTTVNVDSHSVFYRVMLNGCINSTRTTVVVLDNPTAGTIGGTTTVCPDETTALSISGASSGLSFSGTWSSSDAMVATVNSSTGLVSGVSPGMVTITYTATNIFSTCSSSTSTVVTVLDCDVVEFSGKIKYSKNNTLGVQNATVNLSGSAMGSDVTDVNGDFSISEPVLSGIVTLKPVKNTSKIIAGVNVADVQAIQKHAANTVLIADNYDKVCADVNNSNSITSFDATILNQALLNIPAALAQFKTAWRFVPTSHTMANPPWPFPEQRSYSNISGNQTGQDFYGMKIGDVVTAFANPANFGAGEPLVLRARDRILQSGESFEVAFGADQLDDLAAFQLGLAFDPALLQFEAVEPLAGLPIGPEHFGLSDIDKGELRIAWSQAQSLAVQEAAPVFRLRFTALQSSAKLSEALRLDDAVLQALAYNAALAESKTQLRFSAVTGTGDPLGANALQLLQNRPNPFSNTTAIGFVLPEACEAQLRIFDVSGRLLSERKKQYPAGTHEEKFELGSATGVLYYELTTPFGVLARKMTATNK